MGTNARVHRLLKNYHPNKLEWRIWTYYQKHDIQSPCEIDLNAYAKDAAIWVHYAPLDSTNYEMVEDMYTIIIDNRLPPQQQRVELAHELGHVILHTGDQETLSEAERTRQEWQANQFAMYALAPTYMLAKHMIDDCSWGAQVVHLAEEFNVPIPFMDVRLRLLSGKLYGFLSGTSAPLFIARETTEDYDYSYRHPFDETLEYVISSGEILGLRKRYNG